MNSIANSFGHIYCSTISCEILFKKICGIGIDVVPACGKNALLNEMDDSKQDDLKQRFAV